MVATYGGAQGARTFRDALSGPNGGKGSQGAKVSPNTSEIFVLHRSAIGFLLRTPHEGGKHEINCNLKDNFRFRRLRMEVMLRYIFASHLPL